jgi:hypothetical protein
MTEYVTKEIDLGDETRSTVYYITCPDSWRDKKVVVLIVEQGKPDNWGEHYGFWLADKVVVRPVALGFRGKITVSIRLAEESKGNSSLWATVQAQDRQIDQLKAELSTKNRVLNEQAAKIEQLTKTNERLDKNYQQALSDLGDTRWRLASSEHQAKVLRQTNDALAIQLQVKKDENRVLDRVNELQVKALESIIHDICDCAIEKPTTIVLPVLTMMVIAQTLTDLRAKIANL